MESVSVLRAYTHVYSRIERLSSDLQEANFELRDTEQAIVRFVPFDFLRSLGKEAIRDVHAGDSAITEMTVMHCGFHMNTPATVEATHELADRLAPCIHRHDGFLNDYRGDGLQALFQSRPNDALAAAKAQGRTDKVLVFDGSYVRLTVSPTMAEFLKQRAPEVSRRVDEELLPMWLRQRGLEGYAS